MTKILVVDDNPEAIQFISIWLENHSYQTLEATSGEEALRVTEAQSPDLVLLDVMMPGLDGIETCRRLRQNEKTSHIPVILVTAHDPHVARTEGLMAGANDYIAKPINPEDLLARIEALLAGREISLQYSEQWLLETMHGALVTLPCKLAWLLTLDSKRGVLTNRAIATSKGEEAAEQFIKTLAAGADEITFSLQDDPNPFTKVALSNVAQFNLPLSTLPKGTLLHALERLGLYFITIAPLQVGGLMLGVLTLGLDDPHDVETTHGLQLVSTVVSQAEMAVNNARLVRRLTERESETNKERAFNRMLLDNMGDGLLVYDETGKIQFVNQRLARMTQLNIDELQGRKAETLFHPEEQTRVAELVGNTKLDRTASFEFRLMKANGRSLPVLAIQASSKVAGQGRVMVLTDLTEQKAREQALTRQSQRLDALLRATQAISSTLSIDEAIENIVNEVSQALNATMASVMLWMRRQNMLMFHSSVGPGADKLRGVRIPIDQGLAGYVAREGKSILVEDAYQDKRFYKQVDGITNVKTSSVAAVPLVVQGEVVGVVEVINEEPAYFNSDDVEVLEGMAHSAAIAIENARLFGETQRRVRELTLLLQAGEAASSTLATEQVLEKVARMLIDALSVKWCFISAWNKEEETLSTLAEVAEIAWPKQQGRRISISDFPLIQQVLETHKPVATSLNEPNLSSTRREILTQFGLRAVLILPILIDGQVAGVVELYHVSATHLFSAGDLERCHVTMQNWRQTLTASLPWTDVSSTQRLAAKLLQNTNTAWCTVMAFQASENGLRVVYDAGRAIWPIGERLGQGLDPDSLRRVALAEKTSVVSKLEESKLSPADRQAYPRIDQGTLIIAPLMAHGEAIGLVQLLDTDPDRRYGERDLSVAQAIANVVGNALENTRLYNALSQRAAQLEAAYNDLEMADQTKNQLIQNVSHEMRTPLTALTGYMDLLLNEYLGEITDEQRDALEVVNAKSIQLTQLVEDMLTLQEMEKGELYRHESDLSDVAERAIQAVQPIANQKHILLLREFGSNLPAIQIDPERIFRVFHHLLSNAIKFSPDGGQVTITLRDTGSSIQAEVSDNGIGIDKQEQDKIWRRFYQVDGSTTRSYGGTGLGLTIVKQIIEGHEGRVWVESELGSGSTFAFSLPKDEVAGHNAAFEVPPSASLFQ